MVTEFIVKLYQFVTSSGLLPIIEFATIGFIVMVTYFAMHAAFSQAKQSAKFILSTLVGLTGYTVGKLVIIAWIINPIISQSTTKNPFIN